MHPAIRIVSLLIVVACLPFLSAYALYACGFAAALSMGFVSASARRAVVQGIWRLRWLLLAIFMLYLLFNGGAPPGEAIDRVLALCLAVSAVQFALHGLAPGLLADGLVRVLAPLRPAGLETERFARRLVMTLAAVPQVQEMIAAQVAGNPAQRAAALIHRIETVPPESGEPARLDAGPVPPVQWLWPLVIAAAAMALFIAAGVR